MDNPELVLQSLEHFPQSLDEGDCNIPMELEDYIHYVAKTGDPVFQWTLVKPLFREKIIKVVTDFFESTPGEIPDYPNVNKFNYDSMKATLLERIDWFKGAPFTIQRISELLVHPTKEYNRVDKYMRALEKNIYVVSIREPGMPQPVEENNTTFEESFILNGNDFELKSESSELLGNKEDHDAAALLLMKKCSNSEADEVNFNIEVDVTNTTPLEDVQADNIVDSAEINVHEETSESSESSEGSLDISDGKCGQTRKHEDEDGGTEENEPKRFKMDEDENEIKEDSEVVTEEVPSQEVDLNVEPSEDSFNVTQEQDVESKSDNEMELEETVDNKIDSFDTADKDDNNSLLNVSEGDSMVISSQETSEENIEKSIEENLDPIVSESSDMDLSDGVASEITPALLEQPDPDKTSDNDETNQPLLTEKQEDMSTSSTDTANDNTSVDKEISSEAEPSAQDPSEEAVSKSTSEQISNNVQPDLTAVSETPSPNQEETNPTEEVQSSEQSPADNIATNDDITTAAVESEAASIESAPEVEQAILQEDEYTEVEETGSNVDPLSTECADSEQMEKVALTDDKDKDTSASEEPTQVDSS